MKRILTQNNSVVLQELQSDGSIILQLGYALGGITYKIENNNVKFYLKDDYFYKNCIFSADLPLNIDGTEYDEDHIAEAMGNLFPINGGGGGGEVVSVNGKTGVVRLTANDVGAYTTDEVDDLLDGLEAEIDGLGEELGNYYTKPEVDGKLDEKQDILTAGTNITIENNVISATGCDVTSVNGQTGDVVLTANDVDAYTTDEVDDMFDNIDTALNGKQDKLTAGQNIIIDSNNVISATGGGTLEQVQSDWNESDSTKVDYIKNKPDLSVYAQSSSLATVATSGDYNDLSNKPTIPAAQVNADWNASSGVAQILNKPTIPTVPTNVSAFTNDAGYLTQHQSLANYYTKTESDNRFALKFTDVDDIQMVSALPVNPDSRILYLIPVQ